MYEQLPRLEVTKKIDIPTFNVPKNEKSQDFVTGKELILADGSRVSIAVLCDGVGSGDESHTSNFAQAVAEHVYNNLAQQAADIVSTSTFDACDKLTAALKESDLAGLLLRFPGSQLLATTLAVSVKVIPADPNRQPMAHIMWMGDSVAYLRTQSGQLKQVTYEHEARNSYEYEKGGNTPDAMIISLTSTLFINPDNAIVLGDILSIIPRSTLTPAEQQEYSSAIQFFRDQAFQNSPDFTQARAGASEQERQAVTERFASKSKQYFLSAMRELYLQLRRKHIQVDSSKSGNVTRYVGRDRFGEQKPLRSSQIFLPIHPDEMIILASDGVSDNLNPEELEKILNNQSDNSSPVSAIEDELQRLKGGSALRKIDDMSAIVI